MTMTATNEIFSKVRGTTFRDFDWSVIEEGDPLVLEREPSNQYDANAIKCLHDAAGFVGYIGKDLAASLAPTIDSGARAKAFVTEVTGGTERGPNRGLNIRIVVEQEVG